MFVFQENPLSTWFSNCFSIGFSKKWADSFFPFISRVLVDLSLSENSFSSYADSKRANIKLGVDFKYAPKEEGVKLKLEGASQVVREGLVDLN